LIALWSGDAIKGPNLEVVVGHISQRRFIQFAYWPYNPKP